MSSITGSSIEEKTRFLLSLKPSPCHSFYPIKVGRKCRIHPTPYESNAWRNRKPSTSSFCSSQPSSSSSGSTHVSLDSSRRTGHTINPLKVLVDAISHKLEMEELDIKCGQMADGVEAILHDHNTVSQTPCNDSNFPSDLASIDVSSFKKLMQSTRSISQTTKPSKN